MNKDEHICLECGKLFKYCRACLFKPIQYHDAGFCSDECCTAYRTKDLHKPAIEKTQPVVIEEPIMEEAPVIETSIVKEEVPVEENPVVKATNLQPNKSKRFNQHKN